MKLSYLRFLDEFRTLYQSEICIELQSHNFYGSLASLISDIFCCKHTYAHKHVYEFTKFYILLLWTRFGAVTTVISKYKYIVY